MEQTPFKDARMMPRLADAWPMGAIALALIAVGCSDFSQHHIGGVRRNLDPADGHTIAIKDTQVQPAKFEPDPKPQAGDHPLRGLHQRAVQRHATMDSYIYRMKRRESVNGSKQPEEIMAVKLRREPFSVHMKWLGPQGKGREVVYVQGKFNNEMQILTAAGDIPFFPGGSRMAFGLDSALVKGKSRYPITSTGFGSLIDRYGAMVTGIEKGAAREGTAKYLGKVKRPEFDAPVEAVQQTLPPNADGGLPKGGQRWWHFDAASGLPVLILAHDAAANEIEYYCYDLIQFPVRLDDDDFNPDRLWRK
jgi:hypothetical protein